MLRERSFVAETQRVENVQKEDEGPHDWLLLDSTTVIPFRFFHLFIKIYC